MADYGDLFVEPSTEWLDMAPTDDNNENPASHDALLDSMHQLGGERGPSASRLRHEGGAAVSEFHSAKSAATAAASSRSASVSVHQLLDSLGDRAQMAPLRRRLNKTQRQHTLPPPADKLTAARAQRAAGFEAASHQASRWEGVVMQRRSAHQLSFPLERPPLSVDTAAERVGAFHTRSSLEQQVTALLGCSDSVVPAGQTLSRRERRALAAMSLDEALARRNELARHRALLSYQEARQRRQNRIKSRRYHRSLKREATRQHLAEFERLKVCDPEAALLKLQQLDRQRLEERASQRHRNTGRWARLQALKRHYDPEAREALAQSLRLSKELKQKNTVDEEDVEEQKGADAGEQQQRQDCPVDGTWTGAARTQHDVDNPWLNERSEEGVQEEKQDKNEGEDYQDVWSAEQAVKQLLRQSESAEVAEDNQDTPAPRVNTAGLRRKKVISGQDNSSDGREVVIEEAVQDKVKRKQKRKVDVSDGTVDTVSMPKRKSIKSRAKLLVKKPAVKTCVKNKTNGVVGDKKTKKIDKVNSMTLDELFDQYEDALNTKYSQRAADLQGSAGKKAAPKRSKKKHSKANKKSAEELGPSSHQSATDQDHSDETIDTSSRRLPPPQQTSHAAGEGLTATRVSQAAAQMVSAEQETAVPSQHVAASTERKQTAAAAARLNVNVPLVAAAAATQQQQDGVDEEGIEVACDDRRLALADAFADDDVLAEFESDKRDVASAEQPRDEQRALPGWGDWGGPGLALSVRKRRRLLFRAPRAVRRDSALPHVILSETRADAVRAHQVSELPHYFRSVAAFEASIRAPLGRAWMPADAHNKLVQPRCVTRAGTVIPPMDESQLLKKRPRRDRAPDLP